MAKTSKTKAQKIRDMIFHILITLLIFIVAFLILVEHWAFTTWSNLKMEEIVYQLTNPIEGTAGDIMNSFYLEALLPAIIIAVAAGILFFWFLPKKVSVRKIHLNLIISLASLGLIIATVTVGFRTLDIGTWLKDRNSSSDFIEENYADPAKVSVTFPETKRNLIYIFLESMEMTYSDKKDGGAFKDNYIPELTQLAKNNEDFSGNSNQLNGGIAVNNTTWTIAAMFGQTSGLPLKLDVDSNSYKFQHFFPNMTALGDILQKQGYQQTLLVGSDVKFASRNVYFTDHGHYNLEDYYSMMAQGRIPQGYKVWWGFEDQKLFQFAKEDLTKIGNSGQPFNYTMLTVDTHFPDGYVCDLCRNDFGDNQYANVIACSSRQVTDFVAWAQQQSWYPNTTIVISGDHPTMDGDFCKDVPSSYQRKVYTCYINAAATPADPNRTRTYSTLDDFPTTIAALGAHIDGDRLGLGTNLFSSRDTLLEQDGLTKVNSEIAKNSNFMKKLASINKKDQKASELLRSVKVRYKTVPQADGSIAITAKGLSEVQKYITSLSIHIYNRNNTNQVVYLPAADNGDGTYTVIFNPNSGDLPKDDAYYFQAEITSDSVGKMMIGSRETLWPNTLKDLQRIKND